MTLVVGHHRFREVLSEFAHQGHHRGPRLRQQMYLRALGTLPNVRVHLGRFSNLPKTSRLVKPPASGPDTVLHWKTEEKGSDVRLASRLVADACHKRFDLALVVTNDSDLLPPIQIVRNEIHLPIIVVAPTINNRRVAIDLKNAATSVREVRANALAASQFAWSLTDKTGTFTKPKEW